MRAFESRHQPEFVVVMRMFQIIVAIGLFFSLVMLAKNISPEELGRHLLYMSWFAVTFISIEAILNWIKLGVYALIAATVVVTILDLFIGAATFGGASLGLLVAFLLLVYVRPLWHQFD